MDVRILDNLNLHKFQILDINFHLIKAYHLYVIQFQFLFKFKTIFFLPVKPNSSIQRVTSWHANLVSCIGTVPKPTNLSGCYLQIFFNFFFFFQTCSTDFAISSLTACDIYKQSFGFAQYENITGTVDKTWTDTSVLLK